MKNTIYLLLVIIILVSGCEGAYPKGTDEINIGEHKFEIITIDSCEYILSRAYTNNYTVTHKGNCKFCKDRENKKNTWTFYNSDTSAHTSYWPVIRKLKDQKSTK